MFQRLVLGVDSPVEKSRSYELERFIDELKKAGLFKAVEYTDRLSGADLVLTSFFYKATDAHDACPLGLAGQILTIASIGLVPQICNSKSQVSFSLYSPKDNQRKKTISFTHQTRTIFGWAALLSMPSSAWSSKPPDEEYPNLLKAVFYREASDIQRLLRSMP